MLPRNDRLVRKKFMDFLLPSVLMAMSTSLSLIIDSMIVGNLLGSNELASMNLIMPLSLCFTAITAIFGIGSSIDIAMLKGKLDDEGADKCLSLSCLAWLVLSTATVLLGVFASDPIAAFLSGGSGLQELTAEYLRVYLIGAPFTFVTMIFPHIIRSDGMPKLASNVLVIANTVNLLLDLVFMGPLAMGLSGGALATISGYALGTALYLVYAFSGRRTLRLVRIKPADLRIYVDMIRLSVSSILGQGLMFGKIWIFNMLISGMAGKEGLAAFSVCTSCLSFASMFIAGAAQTMMPMVGAFVGAKDDKAVGYTAKMAFRTVLICCGAATILFELFPAVVLGLFGVTSGSGLDIGVIAVREFSLALPGIGISFLFMYYAQSRKMTAFSTQICVLEGFVIIVPVGILMANAFGIRGFWLAYAINEVLIICFIYLNTRRISKKSHGELQTVFLLRKPDPGVLEMTLNVSDETQRAQALTEILRHGTRSGVEEMMAAVFAAAEQAYEERKVPESHRWMDVIVENDRITCKDMGKPYESVEELQQIALDSQGSIQFQYTQMIGMNYSEIQE